MIFEFDEKLIGKSYVQSMVLAAALVAMSIWTALNVSLVFIDFIHGNPHRTQENAIEMMLFQTPITCIIAVVGIFLVFALPQFFQASLAKALMHKIGTRGYFGVLLALPLTAVLTWYSYDYLTPSNIVLGINAGPDWVPYQHGITVKRYFQALGLQSCMTACATLCLLNTKPSLKRMGVICGVLCAITIGGVWGYYIARGQYQFLGS